MKWYKELKEKQRLYEEDGRKALKEWVTFHLRTAVPQVFPVPSLIVDTLLDDWIKEEPNIGTSFAKYQGNVIAGKKHLVIQKAKDICHDSCKSIVYWWVLNSYKNGSDSTSTEIKEPPSDPLIVFAQQWQHLFPMFQRYCQRYGMASFPPIGADKLNNFSNIPRNDPREDMWSAAIMLTKIEEMQSFSALILRECSLLDVESVGTLIYYCSLELINADLLSQLICFSSDNLDNSIEYYVWNVRPAGRWSIYSDNFVLKLLTSKGELKASERLQNAIHAWELDMYRDNLLSPNHFVDSPSAMEQAVADYFASKGFAITLSAGTGDQGADVICERGSVKIVVQVKFWSKPTGNKAVQEVIAAQAYYNGNVMVVVSPSGFTQGAIDLAQKAGVILVDSNIWNMLLSGEANLV